MQEAELPRNEAGRVATLHSLGMLDTPREDRFDHYTRVTARIFDTPIAAISLVDRDRQWFKSAEGLDVDETPRNISLCGHAILGDGVFEVRDARRDPRFRDNPLVLEPPHLRFYAGAPLRAPDGHKLGTLCIIDTSPRQLSDADKGKLKRLADMVVGELLRDWDGSAIRPDHTAQAITATEFFDSIEAEQESSVLLFDIDDVLASNDAEHPGMSPGAIFTRLLHDHFPTASSIAHIGNYHFCVLLETDHEFDEVRAINRLCSDAKNLLCFADGHDSLSPFVGRMHCGSNRYISVDDMRRDAERMFITHEKQPESDGAEVRKFLKEMIGWRKTIF